MFNKVSVDIDAIPDDGWVHYLAAAPIDRRESLSGSAMPFANPQQAFGPSANRGRVRATSGLTVDIPLSKYPNAYYTGLGTTYVPPCLHVAYKMNGVMHRKIVYLGQGVPFRTLAHPVTRTSAMFYNNLDLPVRTQEDIVRSSAFPDTAPRNFWGLRPPV